MRVELNTFDSLTDFFGGLRGLLGQFFDLMMATTAKPLPASPALAASMVAFNASKLVWDATPRIRSSTLPIICALVSRLSIVVEADQASFCARFATLLAWEAFCATSDNDALVSSMAAATVFIP